MRKSAYNHNIVGAEYLLDHASKLRALQNKPLWKPGRPAAFSCGWQSRNLHFCKHYKETPSAGQFGKGLIYATGTGIEKPQAGAS